jgi:glutathione S-transferase
VIDRRPGNCAGSVEILARRAQKRVRFCANAALAGRDWLVRAAATLADFAIGAGLTHAKAMDLPLGDYPDIRAWNERVMGLEGMKKTAG